MVLGSYPILSLTLNNHTIAASAGGTAAATVLNASFSMVAAKSFSVFNYTKRDLELLIGPDIGTTAAGTIFVPGDTTAHFANGFLMRQPINIQNGNKLWARTIVDTPITVSSTLFLRIDFWA